jgi:uncharacterized membrane protein YcaP (DUF421 family)
MWQGQVEDKVIVIQDFDQAALEADGHVGILDRTALHPVTRQAGERLAFQG